MEGVQLSGLTMRVRLYSCYLSNI